MTAHERSDALHARVCAFMDASLRGEPSEPFDALACDLARHQADGIPEIARAFRSSGVQPATLADSRAIPAAPTDVFRLRRLATHAAAHDARVFETSGTTDALRGRHALRRLDTYAHGALAWAERMLWPDAPRLRVLLLASDEVAAPGSSLSFMLARFVERHALGGWFWDGKRLDVDGFALAVDAAAADGAPVLVAGTSFAFVHLCDGATRRLALPPGSRAMQTGGFKGRSREVDADALRLAIADLLGLAPTHVVGEYGMTELSSQLYQSSLSEALAHRESPPNPSVYRAPPWLKVVAVDPVSLEPRPPGREGLARFVDLANVDSSVAVQTADRIVVHDDGGVELLGRFPGAPPRGCSLALEQALGSP